MQSILEDLFEGKLHPDDYIVSKNPQYRPINRKMSAAVERCKDKFSETDFQLLEEVLDLYGRSHSMHSAASFVHGFKMGALMMIEVFTSSDELAN